MRPMGWSFGGTQYRLEYTPGFVAAGWRRFEPETPSIADLERASEDADAAERLGTTPEAMAVPVRATELCNWLAHIGV